MQFQDIIMKFKVCLTVSQSIVFNSVTHKACVRTTHPAMVLFKDNRNIGRQIHITGKLKTLPLKNQESECGRLLPLFTKNNLSLLSVMSKVGRRPTKHAAATSFRKTSILIHTAYFCKTANALTSGPADSRDAQFWANVDENRVDAIGYIESTVLKGPDFRAFTLYIKPYELY